MKKKIVVFHPAIAPYRIDFFNEINNMFDSNFYIFRENLLNQKFNQEIIKSQLNFTPNYLTKGINLTKNGKMIRFGIFRIIIKHKPDYILCSEFNIITFYILIIRKLFLKNIKVLTICDDSIEVAINSKWYRKFARYLSGFLLDGIILSNIEAENWFSKNYPNLKTNVFPIIQDERRIGNILSKANKINGFDYLLSEKKILLFVGRLTQVKNLNFLIEAYSDSLIKNNYILVIVGDGEKEIELKLLTKKLNIESSVLFIGRLEDNALFSWYKIADNLILPSTSETFGAVVNEALIAGIPVLCSNRAGASCLIDKNNGKLFDPYSKHNLIELLNNIDNTSKHNCVSIMPYTFDEKFNEFRNFIDNINNADI